jgi:alpha/beta superfamily hydrolase
MGATDFAQKMKQPVPLDKMKVPVLDVFGSKEYPAVLSKAPGRLLQITKAANPKSSQIIVPGADHYFTDKGDELVESVAKWLNSL